MVDEDTNAKTLMPSKKRLEMTAWRDYISHQTDVSKELDADFNFPNIHLWSHWVDQIRRYGALQLYSAERHGQAHKTNLEDCWNASNHNLHNLPQVFTFQRRIFHFEIKVLNPHALALRRENSTATCTVLTSGADLAAPVSSPSYGKPKFMGPQNRRDGNHSDAIISDFRALLDNTQVTTYHMTIYIRTQQFLKNMSLNKMYISDEQLHAMELCMYHAINVEVEDL